jgi:hypothetical protein
MRTCTATAVIVCGTVLTFDTPTKVVTRRGLWMQVASSRDIRLPDSPSH